MIYTADLVKTNSANSNLSMGSGKPVAWMLLLMEARHASPSFADVRHN